MTLSNKYAGKTILGGEAELSLDTGGGSYTVVAYGEAKISVDRAAVVASQSGQWSDYKRAGKIDVKGSVSRLLVDGELWNNLIGATQNPIGKAKLFNLKINGSSEDGTFTFSAECKNCFFTSGEIICGSSDTFIEEPHDFEMQDVDEDFTMVIT